MVVDVEELRNHIADFDDFFRPIRSYFYWEKHCYDIPVCWSLRSVFDTLDGIDVMTEDINNLLPLMQRLDTLMPQLTAMMPEMIQTMKSMKAQMLSMHSTQEGLQDQMAAMQEDSATTTRSICLPRFSTIPTSNAAWNSSSRRTGTRCGSSSATKATR